MTAAEKLERAKTGDEYAYGLLCNDSADGLYAVAVLTLNRPEDAQAAVKNAFRDGFASIAQIKDGAHMRAWLARELTKHLVAQIKDYRAREIDLPEEDAFSKLASLDRIVCALRYTFRYNAREIALITGLKEETVKRKLDDSDKKLGKTKTEILMRIAGIKLPDELKTPELPKEEKLKKLTVPTASENKAKKKEQSPQRLDAKTFIGVITAQKIKGKEFLQLMGNTRISNDVYREIRENPDLTRERLIELLEASPLTSEDYYKLLSAVKRRNELVERKEQAEQQRRQAEAAGLFTLGQKKSDEKREEPAPPEEKPSEKPARAEKPKTVSAPKSSPKTENKSALNIKAKPPISLRGADPSRTGPFQPIVNTAVLDRLSDGADFGEEKGRKSSAEKIASPKKTEQRPEPIPAKPDAPEPSAFRPAPPVFDEEDEEAVSAAPTREKYKGREFFIDDDVYYRGVNNGKLAFCAVCAVLLLAGGFGIRLLTTGSALPTEKRIETEAPAEAVVIASDEDVLTAAAAMKSRVQHNSLVSYRTSGEPYAEPLTTDFCETDEYLYSLGEGSVRAVLLSPENPRIAATLPLDPEKELIGFTARGNRFYLVSREKDNAVCVEAYDGTLHLTEQYRQDGRFVAINAEEEFFTLITAVDPETNPKLPTYRIGETKKTVGYESVTAAEGAVCGGFSVIGTVSGGEARVSAVLGGYDAYASFDGDQITLLLPDWNTTHLLRFRRIGTSAELLSSEKIRGECYGADCLNKAGDCAVTYNSAEGYLTVQKKTEEGYTALEGFAAGEKLSGVSFSDTLAYIVTEVGEEMKLYCVDLSGEEPQAADANPNAVYFDRLAAFGENLIGLSAESDENGARTALLLSVYGYTDEPILLRTARVTVDENTAPEYARYLSGDAEANNARIAVSEDGAYAAISCVYFDGLSEIERFLCFRDNGLALEPITELYLYDIQSRDRFAAIRGRLLYAVTDSSITVIDLESGERRYFPIEG